MSQANGNFIRLSKTTPRAVKISEDIIVTVTDLGRDLPIVFTVFHTVALDRGLSCDRRRLVPLVFHGVYLDSETAFPPTPCFFLST
jgi:hypothetical protein